MCEACYLWTKENKRKSIHLWKDREENGNTVASEEMTADGGTRGGGSIYYLLYMFSTFWILYHVVCLQSLHNV